jgi:serine/threonine protein kinase
MESKALKRSSGWRKVFFNKPTNAETTPQRHSSYTQSNPEKEPRTLESTYGRPNKILSNEGAGGAILLVTRRRDSTTFAVKRYTPRQHYEDELKYTCKIAAEFSIGARLHHTNIIKTLDLFNEHDSWLQVMEYAPHCLFDRVMSRQMSTDENNCAFMQILAGANHLHRSGFAHRDLKLENVVITNNGIMKLIDFGSAILCNEPGRRNATGKSPPIPHPISHQLTRQVSSAQSATCPLKPRPPSRTILKKQTSGLSPSFTRA